MDTGRTSLLIGEEGVNNLKDRYVTIVGTGGVGGYVSHMLVRAGVGRINLVDFDRVSSSNINRQVVANVNTIGRLKVEVLKTQLLEINPELEINIFPLRLTEESLNIIPSCDMVVDAIDSVKDKVALIKYCKGNDIPIISAMGAGNRYDIPKFYLTDIYKTHDDGLAKAIRKKLREAGVKSLEVVTCDSKPVTNQTGVVGSISYYPAMCGITIAAVIINKFLENI